MEEIMSFLNTDIYKLILPCLVVILFLIVFFEGIKIYRLKKRYINFMKKIGDGKNLEEDLTHYMNRVNQVAEKTEELANYCKILDNDISSCIQKIGMVRYSAFKDTGSDLSFTLALLNEKNDGVVLNGIYSREMSNIYAKPIEKGTSKKYTLSEEEKEAIDKAINSEGTYKIKE